MIVARVVQGVTDHFLYRFPEWIGAAITTQFACTLLRSGATFGSSHSYDLMASFASEGTWGLALLLIGASRVIALFLNGTIKWFKPWSPVIRSTAAYLSAFAWCTIALGMYRANPVATGWGTYTVIMAMDIVMAVVVAREAGKLHRKVGNGRT